MKIHLKKLFLMMILDRLRNGLMSFSRYATKYRLFLELLKRDFLLSSAQT